MESMIHDRVSTLDGSRVTEARLMAEYDAYALAYPCDVFVLMPRPDLRAFCGCAGCMKLHDLCGAPYWTDGSFEPAPGNDYSGMYLTEHAPGCRAPRAWTVKRVNRDGWVLILRIVA